MQNDSKIAVAMSVHKAADLAPFRQAIDSLFAQGHRQWVLFLFCDGPLSAEMDHYIGTLPRDRVRVVKSEKNIGLAASLNRIIDKILAEGGYSYLARMDADDISLPERFSRQICYLEENPDIGLLGTWCREIDGEGRVLFEKRLPTEHKEMLRFMALRNPIVHASVMTRVELFQDGMRYSPELRQMQDYEFWSRLASKGVRMANIPEFLLLFRRDNDFFARRGGWCRAWRDVMIRVDHMRTFGLFSARNLVLLSGIFALRVAPPSLKRFAYFKFR